MEESVKRNLKRGFTIARWGIDICLGALFVVIALIISAFIKDSSNILNRLMIPFGMCVVGLCIFVIGRVLVGLQSRKLNFYMDRPLTEEERWFVSCMLEIEQSGSGVNFTNSVASASNSRVDDIAAGAASTAVVGRFFKIGKKYMGRSFLFNRLPAIVSLIAAVVIVIMAII